MIKCILIIINIILEILHVWKTILNTQWAKIRKEVQIEEAALFASKAKSNFKEKIMEWLQKEAYTCRVKQNFQKLRF